MKFIMKYLVGVAVWGITLSSYAVDAPLPDNSYENIKTLIGWSCNTDFYKVQSICVKEDMLPDVLLKAIEGEKHKLIKEATNQYYRYGNCPCPYSVDGRGYRCGARSAYSRVGGHKVYCYKEDIGLSSISLMHQKREFYKQKVRLRKKALKRLRLKIKALRLR